MRVSFIISLNFVTQLLLPVMKCTLQSQNTVLRIMFMFCFKCFEKMCGIIGCLICF